MKCRYEFCVVLEILDLRLSHTIAPSSRNCESAGGILSKSADQRPLGRVHDFFCRDSLLRIYSRACQLIKQSWLDVWDAIPRRVTHRAARPSRISRWPRTKPLRTVPANARSAPNGTGSFFGASLPKS